MADGPTAVGLLGGRARRAVTSVCGWKFGAKAGGRTSAGKWARMAMLIEADPADRGHASLAQIAKNPGRLPDPVRRAAAADLSKHPDLGVSEPFSPSHRPMPDTATRCR